MGDKATKVIPLASSRRILTVSAAWKTWDGDEPWTQDDIAWFAKFSERSYRVRRAFPNETIRALASTDDITLDDSFQVVVREKDVAVHVRIAANFNTKFADDDEDTLQALFALLEDGGQTITAADIAILRKHSTSSLLGPRGIMTNILYLKSKDKELVEKKYGGETVLDFQSKAKAEDDAAITCDDFCAYMQTSDYIFLPTRDPWPASRVDARLGPIRQDGKKMKASAWLARYRPVEQMTWAPGLSMMIKDRLIEDGGWIDRPGMTILNRYRPPTLKPRAGDAAPWLNHVRKVYPDDADHIIKWAAHRAQRPHEKINHGLLLGGAQGIGKDTIFEPVKAAVGPWNCAEISPKQAMGEFNGFLRSVILRISEARDLGETDRYKFYDHMKSYTVAPPDVLRVNEKHTREYYILNLLGVVMTTNYKTSGVYLPADDRRYYVAWSNLTPNDFSDDYWKKIYEWYDNGGNEIVADYLLKHDIASFDPKGPPLKTAAFWEIVNANRPAEDSELADVLDKLERPQVVTIDQVAKAAVDIHPYFADWLCDRKNRRSIPHRFEECGYVVVTNLNDSEGRWKIANKRHTIYGQDDLALSERLDAVTGLIAQLRAEEEKRQSELARRKGGGQQ